MLYKETTALHPRGNQSNHEKKKTKIRNMQNEPATSPIHPTSRKKLGGRNTGQSSDSPPQVLGAREPEEALGRQG